MHTYISYCTRTYSDVFPYFQWLIRGIRVHFSGVFTARMTVWNHNENKPL